jgi:hypothetical protein
MYLCEIAAGVFNKNTINNKVSTMKVTEIINSPLLSPQTS